MTYEGKKLKVVGTRPIRPDGPDKVTGRARYGADLSMPGMLHCKILRSPHAHARIKKIDASKALKLTGVYAVITGKDFDEQHDGAMPAGEMVINFAHLSRNVMARDKVLYDGHAIAAVAATTPQIAQKALSLIKVDYEILPHVIDVDEAMQPNAPLLHKGMRTANVTPAPKKDSNIASRMEMNLGDLDAGFKEADVIVEDVFKTKTVHQGYIEPHACVASMSEDGQGNIWVSSQGQFIIRDLTAKLLNMDEADLRVTPAEIGGGFGGKTTVYLEPVALLLSKKTGRPVKAVMSRAEVFRATGPTSGCTMVIKIGAKKDGTITAADLELRFMAGAFPGSPVGAACMASLTPYAIPNARVIGYDVCTNTPKVGAYRAPGAPNGAFAVESAMDMLAKKLGMDPFELRLRNAAVEGTKAIYGPTHGPIGNRESMQKAKDHPNNRANLGPNQGRGVASGFWFNIGGQSSAEVNVNEDGSVSVIEGNPDIGGTRAAMCMMAAEVLGIPMEKVRTIVADTAGVGFNDVTGGSRVTFAIGMAVTQAAEKVVEDLRRRAAKLMDVDVDAVTWENGAAHAEIDSQAKSLTLKEIARKAGRTGGPIGAKVSINAQGAGPAFTTHVCDVEVDKETGRVEVLRYAAVQDAGKAIHPSYVEGQIQGGVVQGIGWALNEEYFYDAKGRLQNASFLDYRMPVASDLPMIDAVIVECPNPNHPFGVRGVGEAPLVPPLAAIANAVEDACGVRVKELPISPPALLAAIRAQEGGKSKGKATGSGRTKVRTERKKSK